MTSPGFMLDIIKFGKRKICPGWRMFPVKSLVAFKAPMVVLNFWAIL